MRRLLWAVAATTWRRWGLARWWWWAYGPTLHDLANHIERRVLPLVTKADYVFRADGNDGWPADPACVGGPEQYEPLIVLRSFDERDDAACAADDALAYDPLDHIDRMVREAWPTMWHKRLGRCWGVVCNIGNPYRRVLGRRESAQHREQDLPLELGDLGRRRRDRFGFAPEARTCDRW